VDRVTLSGLSGIFGIVVAPHAPTFAHNFALFIVVSWLALNRAWTDKFLTPNEYSRADK